MERKIIILVLLVSLNLHSQTVDFLGTEINVSNVCNNGSQANYEATEYLKQICEAAGVKNNYILVECNSIKNCLAILNEKNDPIIMYDNSFLKNIKSYGFTEKKIKPNSNENKDWQALTILAHEIGHHANNHFSETKRSLTSPKNIELEADEYAGQIIFKLGGSLQQGGEVYNSEVISVNPTREHPGRADRIKAFENGYKNAKGLDSKRDQNLKSSIDNNELLLGHWIDKEKELTSSFYDDSRYIISQKDKLYKGKWKIENNELVLYLDNSEAKWFGSNIIDINSYTLTLKNEETNQISVLKRDNLSASEYSSNYFKKNWNKLIYIDKYEYTYREIGGIWNIKIPLINKTEFVIDLVRIRVDYYLKNYFGNGGIYKTEYLDYTNVKPKQKIIQKAPNSDRGTSVKSTIIKINSTFLNFPFE
jgi:hypothetical protein